VAFGALGEGFIQDRLGEPWMIAALLAVFGVVLWIVDRRAGSRRGFDSIGVRTGLFLGFAQATALAPGVSRSGITMTAARAIGIDRESAARFSFLLSLPVIAGAGIYEGIDLVREGLRGYGAEFFWGFVSSGVSGYVVVWFLLGYLKRHGYAVFMGYRLVAAAVVLGAIALGVREATI
jgi:undecaprenyl-diphosphatase